MMKSDLSENELRIMQYIDKVMRDQCQLIGRGFSRADIHVAIDLPAIDAYNLSGESPGQS